MEVLIYDFCSEHTANEIAIGQSSNGSTRASPVVSLIGQAVAMLTRISCMFICMLSLHLQYARANGAVSGQAIVQSECSGCHAIGLHDASPNPKSPPFRDVVKRYPPENLVEALAEGIVTGHNEMPEFMFEPDEITAIVGYLESLKEAESR